MNPLKIKTYSRYWMFIKNNRWEMQRNPKCVHCFQNFLILNDYIQNAYAASLIFFSCVIHFNGLFEIIHTAPERIAKIESQQEPSKLPVTSAKSWRCRIISRHGSPSSSYEKRVWHEIFPRVIRLRREYHVSECNSVGKWAVVGLCGDISGSLVRNQFTRR